MSKIKINIAGKAFEIETETLTKAIEEKKEAIDLEGDYIIRTTEEEETFKTNLVSSGSKEAYEIARKNVLKNMGIEVNGAHKSDESTLAAITSFMDVKVQDKLKESGKEPDEKVKALENDLALLKGTISTLQGEKEAITNDYTTFKKSSTIHSTFSKLIPENSIIPNDDMLTLLSTKIKADIDENGNVFAIGADGQPIKNNTTLQLKPLKEVVEGFFNENPQYLKGSTGGNGGGDSGGDSGTKQTIEQFMEEMQGKNISLNSPPFVNEMQKRIKEGKLEA